MPSEITPVDISHLPELLELALEVRSSKQPRVLKCGDQDIAVISPAEPPLQSPARGHRAKSLNQNDWLLRLADIGADSGSPDHATDVASDKYGYLAEAYASLHETEQ